MFVWYTASIICLVYAKIYNSLMGGHGGLNILPQKKWNVYNRDNRGIVQRDKRLHAQKQRKQYEESRDTVLENKMDVLRQEGGLSVAQQANEDKSRHSLLSQQLRRMSDQTKHVNLFEEEEKILQNREATELKRMKEEEFLKDKNMDFSTRFLGTYNDQKHMPWYSKKKGTEVQKPKNKYFKDLDQVIYGVKSDSKITKEIIQVVKREERRHHEEDQRDRTREKTFRKYEDYEDRRNRLQVRGQQPTKQMVKYEEDLLMKEFKNDQQTDIEKMRQKRLRRQQKERRRIEQLRAKRQS